MTQSEDIVRLQRAIIELPPKEQFIGRAIIRAMLDWQALQETPEGRVERRDRRDRALAKWKEQQP